MPAVAALLQQKVREIEVVVRQPALDPIEGFPTLLVEGDDRGTRFLVERIQEPALGDTRAKPIVELGRPGHRGVHVFDTVHRSQPRSELCPNSVLVRERQRAARSRGVLPADEVLDVVGNVECPSLDVVPANGRMRDLPLCEELGEV